MREKAVSFWLSGCFDNHLGLWLYGVAWVVRIQFTAGLSLRDMMREEDRLGGRQR
jgi:hypothetical protein